MRVSVKYAVVPKRRTVHAGVVMDHFGVGLQEGEHVIAEGLDLPVREGDVVCFTGASGSGKSSLMRAVAGQLEGVVNIDQIPFRDVPLVDQMQTEIEESLPLLAACGLGEARLLLRSPGELSDGQRYRFRLALALSRRPRWVLADEFTATLDRTLAKVIAYNISRLSQRLGTGFLLATTHRDVLDDLRPTLHVECLLEGGVSVRRSDDEAVSSGKDESAKRDSVNRESRTGGEGGRKKKVRSASRSSCGSAKGPSPTGRISLGGITAVTR